jgi:hypothetical protein
LDKPWASERSPVKNNFMLSPDYSEKIIKNESDYTMGRDKIFERKKERKASRWGIIRALKGFMSLDNDLKKASQISNCVDPFHLKKQADGIHEQFQLKNMKKEPSTSKKQIPGMAEYQEPPDTPKYNFLP